MLSDSLEEVPGLESRESLFLPKLGLLKEEGIRLEPAWTKICFALLGSTLLCEVTPQRLLRVA